MSRPSRVLGLALILGATAAVPSLAALPVPTSRLIVPGRSLGGVKLGGTFAAGLKAWGRGATCTQGTRFHICSYTTSNFADGNAGFTGKPGGRIDMIQVAAGYTGRDPNFKTSLVKFKTAKGVGLGSTSRAVKSAYPKAKRQNVTGASNYEWVIVGPGAARTRFQMAGTGTSRVIGIILNSS
jgi:hypothetical protein